MANKELDQMRSLLSNIYSEAESKPQPSKTLNSGTAKIDGANPTSPSTNPATRRAEYDSYIKTLNRDQQQSLYNEVLGYKNQGMSNDQIYEKVLSNRVVTPELKTAQPKGVDLTIKGNFDVYNPVDWQNQPELMQQYYVQANNDIKSSRRALSKLMLQQDALSSKSGNVEQVTTLIDAIENAYDRGVFDTETIANTLGVPAETVSLIQQGKANELVTLNQEFVEDELKSFYRAEEDYDTNLQRTMEDFNLAKTNLDRQYNSAMQTLKRNLFDDKRAASVGSAVAGISGSEYAVRVIEAKHQQNMDDLEGNYLYSSISQKYSYTRAIEDYNKNIQRLSEDFDDSLKDIQASVLQQFQEIDNKIGLTTEQLAKAYGTLQQNVLAAKSTATTNYLEALANNENGLANAIANTYGLDTGAIGQPNMRTERNNNPTAMTTDVAKTLGMVEGVDYIVGDKFPNSNLYTARLLGDPVETTIKAFDNAAAKGIGIFYTQGGKQRWSHTAMTNEQWKKLTDDQKRNVIYAMLQREGGNMNNMSYYYEKGTTAGGTQGTTTSTGGTGSYYRNVDDGLYEAYVNRGKTLTSQEIKNIKSDSYYGKNEDERWNNFISAADIYKQDKLTNEVKNIQSSRDLIKDARNSFKNATEGMTDNEIRNAYSAYKEYVKKVENGEAVTIKNLAIAKYLDSNPDLLTAFAQFDQVLAQGFIDTIISSKQKGATYGPLSDNEGRSLRQAYTSVNMLQGRQNIVAGMDKMISNLDTNIKEMSPKQTTSNGGGGSSNGGGGSNNTIGLGDVINIFKNITKSSDLIFSGSSTQNNGGGTQFDTPGGMNTTGQNNSTGGNGTGVFVFPRTNMQ